MKIYTSYFGNHKVLYDNGISMIGITRFPPKWFTSPNIDMVAPSSDLLMDIKRGHIDEIEYTERYKKEIASIDLDRFVAYLKEVSANSVIALVCYEKPQDFCHRHILAEIINEKYDDIEICEFGGKISQLF